MDKSQVNIIFLQIDRNKSHVNIKISCRGQKYATTFANSIFLINSFKRSSFYQTDR